MAGERGLRIVRTAHFDLIYSDETAFSAALLLEKMDSLYDELKTKLRLDSDIRFPVVLTSSPDTHNAYYSSAPFSHIVIYDSPVTVGEVSHREALINTFRHELTHAISYNLHNGFWWGVERIFGDTFNPALWMMTMGLSEGAAVSEESSNGEGRLHSDFHTQLTKQALIEGVFPLYSEIQGTRSARPSGHLSYYFGGAFCQYLQEAYGEDKYALFLHRLVNWQSLTYFTCFREVYGFGIKKAWDGWRASIKAPPIAKDPAAQNFVRATVTSPTLKLGGEKRPSFESLTATKNGTLFYWDKTKSEIRKISIDDSHLESKTKAPSNSNAPKSGNSLNNKRAINSNSAQSARDDASSFASTSSTLDNKPSSANSSARDNESSFASAQSAIDNASSPAREVSPTRASSGRRAKSTGKKSESPKTLRSKLCYSQESLTRLSVSGKGDYLAISYNSFNSPVPTSRVKILDLKTKAAHRLPQKHLRDATVFSLQEKVFVAAVETKSQSSALKIFSFNSFNSDKKKRFELIQSLKMLPDHYAFNPCQAGGYVYFLHCHKLRYFLARLDILSGAVVESPFPATVTGARDLSARGSTLTFSYTQKGSLVRLGQAFLTDEKVRFALTTLDSSGGTYSPVEVGENAFATAAQLFERSKLLIIDKKKLLGGALMNASINKSKNATGFLANDGNASATSDKANSFFAIGGDAKGMAISDSMAINGDTKNFVAINDSLAIGDNAGATGLLAINGDTDAKRLLAINDSTDSNTFLAINDSASINSVEAGGGDAVASTIYSYSDFSPFEGAVSTDSEVQAAQKVSKLNSASLPFNIARFIFTHKGTWFPIGAAISYAVDENNALKGLSTSITPNTWLPLGAFYATSTPWTNPVMAVTGGWSPWTNSGAFGALMTNKLYKLTNFAQYTLYGTVEFDGEGFKQTQSTLSGAITFDIGRAASVVFGESFNLFYGRQNKKSIFGTDGALGALKRYYPLRDKKRTALFSDTYLTLGNLKKAGSDGRDFCGAQLSAHFFEALYREGEEEPLVDYQNIGLDLTGAFVLGFPFLFSVSAFPNPVQFLTLGGRVTLHSWQIERSINVVPFFSTNAVRLELQYTGAFRHREYKKSVELIGRDYYLTLQEKTNPSWAIAKAGDYFQYLGAGDFEYEDLLALTAAWTLTPDFGGFANPAFQFEVTASLGVRLNTTKTNPLVLALCGEVLF